MWFTDCFKELHKSEVNCLQNCDMLNLKTIQKWSNTNIQFNRKPASLFVIFKVVVLKIETYYYEIIDKHSVN